MRLGIVSVAPPYRGGIALNTSILCQKLSTTHNVLCLNYKRQYPNFLFPGKSQFLETPPVIDTPSERIIDSLNPISWIQAAQKLKKFQPDGIVYRFWNPFFAPALGTIARITKHGFPNAVQIALCDNILPHEKHFYDSTLIRYFFNILDGFIVMAPSEETVLLKFLPEANYKRVHHPLTNIFPEAADQAESRAQLGLKQRHIILYFGLVRKYKGLDVLIKAAALMKNQLKDFHVLALGECYEDKSHYRELIRELGVEDVFSWDDRFIPDNELTHYFSAADVVALPYKSATQSGVVPLAYHFNVPVVVTNVGGLPEMVENGKSGFLIPPDDPKALADCLSSNLGSGIFSGMTDFIVDYKDRFSWQKLISGLEDVIHNAD